MMYIKFINSFQISIMDICLLGITPYEADVTNLNAFSPFCIDMLKKKKNMITNHQRIISSRADLGESSGGICPHSTPKNPPLSW